MVSRRWLAAGSILSLLLSSGFRTCCLWSCADEPVAMSSHAYCHRADRDVPVAVSTQPGCRHHDEVTFSATTETRQEGPALTLAAVPVSWTGPSPRPIARGRSGQSRRDTGPPHRARIALRI
jgi:hypothetical protein